MAKKINYEKIMKMDGFKISDLKEVVKGVNESGAIKPFGISKLSQIKLVEKFIAAIDSVPENSEEEKKIPDNAINLYNEYMDVAEDKKVAIEFSLAAGEKKKEEGEKEKGKKSKNVKDKNNVKKIGVIAKIQELITNNPLTEDEIVTALGKTFPDRPLEGMRKTVRVQLPNRMGKEKKIKIEKNDKGKYYVK